jgi:hypothetical protein
MKYRRLQRRFDSGEWTDDAYAYENQHGQVVFRYNLTWGRMGSHLNQQIKERGLSLTMLEKLLPSGKELRWLPIQVITDEQSAVFCAALDQACAIPATHVVTTMPVA